MKTERELFELLKKNAIQNILSVSGKLKTTDVIGEEFDKLFNVIIDSREGYKLVPVEKLEELKRDADRMISSAHLYQDECHIKSFGRSFLHNYKDIMGAAE